MSASYHTIPVNDLIEHNTESDDCVCGPDIEYLDNGNHHVIHHSMDGREHDEPDHDKADCPLCSSNT